MVLAAWCWVLPSRVVVLAALSLLIAATPVRARQVLLVANNGNNTVGKYDAATGTTINAAFVNGQGLTNPGGIAMDGASHIFVSIELQLMNFPTASLSGVFL
jgi:hypothetical protein